MANVIVWGRLRDIVAGDLPVGVTPLEVSTLEGVRKILAEKSAPLILADFAHLASEQTATATYFAGDGRGASLIMAVGGDIEEAEEAIQRYPWLDDAVVGPVTAARLRLRLERALDVVNGRRVITQLDEAIARKTRELHDLNNIGVALSSQRDIDKLLALILGKSREITAADAGSLYLVQRGKDDASTEEDKLVFSLAQNDTVQVPFHKFAMPLNEQSIAGYVALSGEIVNTADVYHLPIGAPFAGSGASARAFDEKSGYRTKSMLVVPMRDHMGEAIGVVQLINKKRDPRIVLRPLSLVDEAVIPFTSVDEELVTSLASQAAIALQNSRLIQSIRDLFNSFVTAAVTAIEQRDPTTSGHSQRVAQLTVGIAEMVDRLETGPFREIRFTRDQLQELNYASLLHDFGKVGVREKVLIKGKKLYIGEMMLVRQRFAYIKRSLEADHLRAKLEQVAGGAASDLIAQMDREYEQRLHEVEELVRMIFQANEPTVLEEESFRALMDLTTRTYPDMDGTALPFLTPNEVAALSIRRGSLSEKERREIESHVTHTYNFLAQIPWTGEYRRVPEIAYAHHEKLDGTGYPRRLQAVDIPIQSKMMTISDIFDALVAWDRPYKKAVPVPKALAILDDEARTGKLDRELLSLFVDAKIYERTLPKELVRPS